MKNHTADPSVQFYQEQLTFIQLLIHYQTDPIILNDMRHLTRLNLKELRQLREAKDLKDIQRIEFAYMNLIHEIETSLRRCDARKKLYNATELPDCPDYETIQQRYEQKYPEFIAHFQHVNRVLQKLMRVTLDAITEHDIKTLLSFSDELKEKLGETDDLYATVQELHTRLSQAQTTKISLLTAAYQSMLPAQLDDPQVKLRFWIMSQQIIQNPFEPPLVITELLQRLPASILNSELKTLIDLLPEQLARNRKVKSSFWDYRPPIERDIHNLAKEHQCLQQVFTYKMEGLKLIAQHTQSATVQHTNLIVGAGPAGLIRAIFFALKNQPFQLLEKRTVDKTARPNTVTLGKWDPKELDILSFTGALADLESHISFGHNRAHYIEVSLGSLERSLEHVLLEITNPTTQSQKPCYEHEISDISPEGISIKHHNTVHQVKPKIVFVTDGSKSTTREQLGIQQVQLSVPSYLVFSIFKDNESATQTTWLQKIGYRLSNTMRGLWLILRVLLYAVVTRKTLETSYSTIITTGPSGLSRIPAHDYLLQIYRREESDVIKKNIDELRYLDQLINYYMQQGDDATQRVAFLKEEQRIREDQLKKELAEQAMDKYGLLDFIHACFNPAGHSMRDAAMTLDKNYPVEIILTRTQQSQVNVNGTLFLLRGDAAHTTDPFSGTGCKTALEELLADQYILGCHEPNEIMLAIMNWGEKHYQSKMHNEAFWERLDYLKYTETLERYADIAFNKEALPDTLRGPFLALITRITTAETLTQQDKNDAAQYYQRLFRNPKQTTAYSSAPLSPEKTIPISAEKAKAFFETSLKKVTQPDTPTPQKSTDFRR